MPAKGQFVAFGAEARAGFVAAIRGGAVMEAAAKTAGVAVTTLYYRRRACPAFAALWAAATAEADAAFDRRPRTARAAGLHSQPGRRFIRARKGRRKRTVSFDRGRKQRFLEWFGGSCNMHDAAEAAGVSVSTVYRHLARDAAFAEGFRAALETGYQLLEAEALRQQRAAQEAYRVAPDADAAAQGRSFGEVMQLLREYNRGGGRVGRRAERRGGGSGEERWTFEGAMELLEAKLVAFGVEIPAEMPEIAPPKEAPPPGYTRSPSPRNLGEEIEDDPHPSAASRLPPSPEMGEGIQGEGL